MDNKLFLQEVINSNELFKSLNTDLVHSRINPLQELPVEELKDILDENKPFDQMRFNEIKLRIENIINQNLNLMTGSEIKNASIEQAIMLIGQKHNDPEFLNYFRNELYTKNDNKDFETIKNDYSQTQIKYDITDYKEELINGKCFIKGLNSNNQLFSVELPNGFTMERAFSETFKGLNDKSKISNLNSKQIATFLFDRILIILKDYAKEITINQDNVINDSFSQSQQPIVNDNNSQMNMTDITAQPNSYQYQEVIPQMENNYQQDFTPNVNIANQSFDNNNQEIPVIENGMKLTKTLTNPNQPKTPTTTRIMVDGGFIKVGTIILFGLSFILTIISLVLLIAS